MRRSKNTFWISIAFLAVLPAQASSAQSFRNCKTLKAKYPNGVAINFGVIGTSGAEINRAVYLKNQKLDGDKDGLICENEVLQSVGMTTKSTTTTTSTTLPITLKTPVSDLSAFVKSHGTALTTIECRSGSTASTGSGTSIQMSYAGSAANDQGIRSTLVTNHHVVERCLSGDWLSRKVIVRTGSVECTGYVWGWSAAKDLAAVYTTCEIPKVFGFTSEVLKPVIGDVGIIIGSAAGIAGTSTQGAVANITDNEILTTAQAAPGSSGGALFNRNGQLLGIVQGGTGSLTVVIPITKFTDVVYCKTCLITWKTTATLSPTSVCATALTCAVGDTGPGGGIVFYVSPSFFSSPGSACSSACKYLEAAPSGWSTGMAIDPAWQGTTHSSTKDPILRQLNPYPGTAEVAVSGADGVLIGTGYQNTVDVLNFITKYQDTRGTKQAQLVKSYNGGGKTDWFIPSKDELNELYKNRLIVGGFSADVTREWSSHYWSSTESGKYFFSFYCQNFISGTVDDNCTRNSYNYVRPIRAFG